MIPDISKDPQFELRFVALGPPAPISRILDVSVENQLRTNWCWAAVALGIHVAYNTARSQIQCDIATRVLGKGCCPSGNGCNKTSGLEPALDEHFIALHTQNGHQTIDFVKDEIDAGNPICARIRRNTGSGHFVVIAGYCITRVNNFLWIWDPDGGYRSPWRFDAFRLHYLQNGFWQRSYETGLGSVDVQIGGPECR